jgi:hypothetical protein
VDFYLDESGNTGDLSRTNAQLEFGGQPIFSLAAIGLSDENMLTQQLTALRKKYNVQSDELKLSKILKRKPAFALEAVELVVREGFPFFVEIVDKKYQLAVSIVNGFVWPPYFNTKESEQTVWLKNIFADYIYHRTSNEVFFRFVQCMHEPSNEKTNKFFVLLKDTVGQDTHEVAQGLASQIEESKDGFRLMIEDEGAHAYKRFLPLPDIGKRNQEVWMLPNFSSFTNIYARINLNRSGKLADSKFIHDEQAHFDEIIETAKTQVEGEAVKKMGYIPPFSDYNIKHAASLFFKASPESTGVQLADIVAGLSMRWYLAHLQGDVDQRILDKAMYLLLEHSNRDIGTGINVVGPHDMAAQLFGVAGY